MRTMPRLATLAAILLGALLVAAPRIAVAIETDSPAQIPIYKPEHTVTPKKEKKKSTRPRKKKKKQEQSDGDFLSRYRHAHNLIFRQHDFAAGIAAARAIGQDGQPDVATMIGYASRKLGRYADAKYWYDKALAADPRHVTTLSYYGMWYAEQGNRLKAKDYLAKVRDICGNTTCRAYAALKDAIARGGTY
jgi:tetratricopeptide (TPR) repeat protein